MTVEQKIAAWLNDGARNYYLGVVYYGQLPSHEPNLYELFRKGENTYRFGRLKKELRAAFADKQPVTKPNLQNKELYEACHEQAIEAYKMCMNKRAVLFALARQHISLGGDPNAPHLYEARGTAALQLVEDWKEVSQLYDRAAFVRDHGRLPDVEKPEEEFEHLADHRVKQALDNTRKAFNKLKKKEATPERVALMQKHESNIKKLEKKWRSLK